MSAPILAIAMLMTGAPVASPLSEIETAELHIAPVSLAPLIGDGINPNVSADPMIADDGAEQDIVVTGHKGHPRGDPLERVNAKAFELTQAVDDAVVWPVAHAFEKAVPEPLRDGLFNFIKNLREPIVAVNYLLQLKPGKAAETVGRFAINSTIGVAGVFDMAKRKPFNLPRRPNGFSDTLGRYGVKPGPFLFLPLLGPTTVRDLFAGFVDRLIVPVAIGGPLKKPAYVISTGVLGTLDRRDRMEPELKEIRESDDPYATRRDKFLKKRQDEIDGIKGRREKVPN